MKGDNVGGRMLKPGVDRILEKDTLTIVRPASRPDAEHNDLIL